MTMQFDWYIGNIDRALDTDVYDNPALLDGTVWDEFAASIKKDAAIWQGLAKTTDLKEK